MAARILFIEDNLTFASVIERVIQDKVSRDKLVIDHCRTMEEGLEKAAGAQAILLDLVLSAIWNAETTPTMIPILSKSAPVIVFSGKKDDGEYYESKLVSDLISVYGADDFVPKDDKDAVIRVIAAINAAIGRRIYKANNP